MKPLEAAQAICKNIDVSDAYLVGSFELHEAGYINFRLNHPRFTYRTIKAASTYDEYGKLNLGKGQKVLVEHTSVNPNKALHVGHLRNVVLGDSICRILKFTGHEVWVLNYVDDSGSQVADIVTGFLHLKLPLEPPSGEKFDHYCGDVVYVKVNELYDSHPELLERKKEVLRLMEDPSSEVSKFAREVTRRILKEQLKTCWRVGASYDCLNFESHIVELELWKELFLTLKEKGIATLSTFGKHRGCWVVSVEGEEEGEEKVLVRSDGTITYVAKDIPYAAWKLGLLPDRFSYKRFVQQPDGKVLWSTTTENGEGEHPSFGGADKAITVIDIRQSRLQRIISHILTKLSDESVRERYIHLGYEVVSLSAKTAEKLGIPAEERRFLHMSGRKGIYINADDVLDALYQRSYEETRSRNPEEAEEWLRSVAEKVAVAAIRFDLLKRDLEKMITFDLDEALNLEGDTGPYIQYAHARGARILEKAGEEPWIDLENASLLIDPSELELIKRISKFDIYVEDAVRHLSPKFITRYAYGLAVAFNEFYERNPVIQERDRAKRLARLALVKAFCNTVKRALYLLGIEAPNRI